MRAEEVFDRMSGEVISTTESSLAGKLKTKATEHRGLLATFIGTFAFAGQTICVRLLKGDVPIIEVVCLRFLLQGVFSFMFALFAGVPIPLKSTREGVLLLVRGISGTVGIGLIYFSLFHMSVGLANAIVFGAPVFVGLFAWIFIKEAFQYRDIILVLVNLAGVVLIAQPPFLFKSETLDTTKKMELIAVVSAVVATLVSALTFIFMRLLGLMNTRAVKIVFYYAICGTTIPGCAGIVMRDWVIPPCGRARYLLILIGLQNFMGQSLLSYGLACTKKSYFVSVVNSSQVPITIILEIIILSVVPNWISLLGTGLVVCSALGVVFREGTITITKGQHGDESNGQNETMNMEDNGRIILAESDE